MVMKLPKVSIVILTKSNLECLCNCINSIKFGTRYQQYEVIVADTGSTPKEKKALQEYLKNTFHVSKKCRLVQYNYYNFAKINNDIVRNHLDNETDLVLFCNDDIEMINDVITYMIKAYTFHSHEVGTMGCRLTFEDGRIQHAGQQLFTYKEENDMYLPLSIVHREYGLKKSGCNEYPEQVLSNTGAFCLVSRDLFLDIGGFNEKYVECFEDVEFNIECIKKGKKNLYLDYPKCVHHEAVTRKREADGQQAIRQNFDFRRTLHPFLNENLEDITPYVKVLDRPPVAPESQYAGWGVTEQYEFEPQV